MILTSILLFIAYFVYDYLYAKWVIAVAQKHAVIAANLSVGIYLIGAWGTILYVSNPWFLIPIVLGAWLGTYTAIRYKK